MKNETYFIPGKLYRVVKQFYSTMDFQPFKKGDIVLLLWADEIFSDVCFLYGKIEYKVRLYQPRTVFELFDGIE